MASNNRSNQNSPCQRNQQVPGDLRQVGDLAILNGSIGGPPINNGVGGGAGPLALQGPQAMVRPLNLIPGGPAATMNVSGVFQLGLIPANPQGNGIPQPPPPPPQSNWMPPQSNGIPPPPPLPGSPIGGGLNQNISGSTGLSSSNAQSLNSSGPVNRLNQNISGSTGLSSSNAQSLNSSGPVNRLNQNISGSTGLSAFNSQNLSSPGQVDMSNVSNRTAPGANDTFSTINGSGYDNFNPSFNSTFSGSLPDDRGPMASTPCSRIAGNTSQGSSLDRTQYSLNQSQRNQIPSAPPGTPLGGSPNQNISGSPGLSGSNAQSINSSGPIDKLNQNISGSTGLSSSNAQSLNSSGPVNRLNQNISGSTGLSAFNSQNLSSPGQVDMSNVSNRTAPGANDTFSTINGSGYDNFNPSFNSTFSGSLPDDRGPMASTPCSRMAGNTSQGSSLDRTQYSGNRTMDSTQVSQNRGPNSTQVSQSQSPNAGQFTPNRTANSTQYSQNRSPDLMQFSSPVRPANVAQISAVQSPSPFSPIRSPSPFSPNRSPNIPQVTPNRSPNIPQVTPNRSPNIPQVTPNRSPALAQGSPNQSPNLMQFSPNVSYQQQPLNDSELDRMADLAFGNDFPATPQRNASPLAGIRRMEPQMQTPPRPNNNVPPQGSPQAQANSPETPVTGALNQMVREAHQYWDEFSAAMYQPPPPPPMPRGPLQPLPLFEDLLPTPDRFYPEPIPELTEEEWNARYPGWTSIDDQIVRENTPSTPGSFWGNWGDGHVSINSDDFEIPKAGAIFGCDPVNRGPY